jgi:hypothetical protein
MAALQERERRTEPFRQLDDVQQLHHLVLLPPRGGVHDGGVAFGDAEPDADVRDPRWVRAVQLVVAGIARLDDALVELVGPPDDRGGVGVLRHEHVPVAALEPRTLLMAAALLGAVEPDLLVHGSVPGLQHGLESSLHEILSEPLVGDDPSSGLPHSPPVLRTGDQRSRSLGHRHREVLDPPVPRQVRTTPGDLPVHRQRVAGGVAPEEALEVDRIERGRAAVGELVTQDGLIVRPVLELAAGSSDSHPEPVAQGELEAQADVRSGLDDRNPVDQLLADEGVEALVAQPTLEVVGPAHRR